ncbi:DUF1326 domain-containing protein [Altererythrobacter sp.]|uniref:DUF1326 domain-containing protein n=1 Tax=Altererythrobacter sp. TaxID=1872480 RepID=UPI003D004BB7
MAYWEFKGRELVNCSCDYGCNCQFGGLPDKGHCHAVFGMIIDEGKHGDTDLSGLKVGAIFKWPGPIHEGHGECVAFVDENASEAQRASLLTIMTGGDTDPMATFFAVFATTVETMHEPVFAPIEFDVDIDGRKGRLRIPGHVEMEGEPIKSPVDGREIRARIDLPDGFEYELAEIGSATSTGTSPVPIELAGSYAQFANLHLNSHGVVHS